MDPRRLAGFALVVICVVVALALVVSVLRDGTKIGLYPLLAEILYALLRLVQPERHW
jgi:hypothetical protein